jgi:hypothetical protein
MHRVLSVALGAMLVSTSVDLAARASQAAVATRAVYPSVAPSVPGTVSKGQKVVSRLLPGTRPNVLARIQGNALSSTNGPLANALVRMRDARSGRIVETQITDRSGLFEFTAVEPGSYIVEIIGNDQTILAASQMLNVNAGEAISAVVKLPFRVPPVASVLGDTTPSAVAVMAAAASAQVLAARATTATSPGGN